MFNPVPPMDDPPPVAREAPSLDEEEDFFPPVRSVEIRSSRRMRIVKFALFGGSLASFLLGGIGGILAGVIMPWEALPFSRVDRLDYYLSGQRFLIWPLAFTLFLAPFMFLVFAMAASAQTIASSFHQVINREKGRWQGEAGKTRGATDHLES